MPKKPVSLRMNATTHAAAKRRAKALGMSSLADYIEALVGHDITEGFDIQVLYSSKGRPVFKAIPPGGKKKVPAKKVPAKRRTKTVDSVGLMKDAAPKKKARKRART